MPKTKNGLDQSEIEHCRTNRHMLCKESLHIGQKDISGKFSLDELLAITKSKISNKEQNSYSYHLFCEGIEKITRKIGEEALEVVIASFIYDKKNDKKSRKELIGEVCDLFYHTLVLLAAQKIEFDEILLELAKRNKKFSKK